MKALHILIDTHVVLIRGWVDSAYDAYSLVILLGPMQGKNFFKKTP